MKDLDLNPMATDNLGELLGFFGLLYCWRALASHSCNVVAWIHVIFIHGTKCACHSVQPEGGANEHSWRKVKNGFDFTFPTPLIAFDGVQTAMRTSKCACHVHFNNMVTLS